MTLTIVVTSSCCHVAAGAIVEVILGGTTLGHHLNDFSCRRIQSIHILAFHVDEADFWYDLRLPGHDVESFEQQMLTSGKVPLHQQIDKLPYLSFCLLGKLLDEVRVEQFLRMRTRLLS